MFYFHGPYDGLLGVIDTGLDTCSEKINKYILNCFLNSITLLDNRTLKLAGALPDFVECMLSEFVLFFLCILVDPL